MIDQEFNLIFFFFRIMGHDKRPRTLDFDLMVPYNVLIDIKSSYYISIQTVSDYKRLRSPIARILATRNNVYVQSVFFMYTCTYVHNVRFDLLLRADIYIYILAEEGLIPISQVTDRSTRQWYDPKNLHSVPPLPPGIFDSCII